MEIIAIFVIGMGFLICKLLLDRGQERARYEEAVLTRMARHLGS